MSNNIILKSGYTKNIKNPVLFNKLVSTPTYSKITNADITAIQNGESKNVYAKFISILDSRLIDKMIEKIDDIQEQMSNQQSMGSYIPAFYYETDNETDEITELVTTYYSYNGEQLTCSKVSAEQLAIFGITTNNEFEWAIGGGLNNSEELLAQSISSIADSTFKIQQFIGEYEDGTFYPYPSDEEPRSHFQAYDSENDHPMLQLEDLFFNGFTIPNDDPEGEDEIVPGFKDYLYIVSGSKAIDLPSEEALKNNTIKRGITFEDKFNEYDSKITEMQNTVNNIDVSWSSLSGKPSIYNNYMSTYTFNDLYLNNLSTRSVTSYNYREVASGNNSISGDVYYNSSYFSYSNYSNFSFVSCDINFTDDFIDYIEDYGCFFYYQSGSYYIGIWIKLVDDFPETLNNKKIVTSSSVKFFYSLYAG